MATKKKFYQGNVLENELRSIYEDRGKLPDMTKLEREHHRRKTKILGGLVAFFAILTLASWSGFLLYGPKSGEGKEIELTLESAPSSLAGVSQELKVHYYNKDNNPVAVAKLMLRLNPQIRVEDATPASKDPAILEWDMGTLEAKQSGDILLHVTPYGIANDSLDVTAIMSYKPSNFNAEFQTSASLPLIIQSSPVDLTLQGPTESTAGKETAFTLSYENTTDTTFTNLVLTLADPPSSFSIDKTDPVAKSPGASWEIPTLVPGQKGTVTLQGTFTSESSAPVTLVFTMNELIEKKEYPLGKISQELTITGGYLSAALFLNETKDNVWIRPGASLQGKLTVTNRSTETLKNIQPTLLLPSKVIDWKNISPSSPDNLTILLGDKGGIELAPGKAIDLSVEIPTLAQLTINIQPWFDATAQISVNDTTIKSNTIRVLLVSDLTLSSEARYFDASGTQIGSGPLPPKVGATTSYVMRLALHNTLHDLSQVELQASLPEGATFINKTPPGQGKLSYNEKTREVHWSIDRLPVTIRDATATFGVSVSPTATNKGTLLGLLGVARVEAMDTITGVRFSTDAPSLSSNLERDTQGRGKGVVVE